jgi:small-conductance mechanosensitive channel
MQMSTRVVLAKLVRAVAFFAAILIALPLVGIDITVLSVFGGALGVGLGFGLQKIASNYVSGFIILLDRSVRIGDLVTVDGRHGTIQEIASRYTVVRSGDGTESIIPNDTLITQSVTNHSYSDKKAVVKVSFVVGYGADIDRVFEIMESAGRGHSRALPDPPPQATITKVADPGVEVELAVWIDDAHAGQQQIRSELFKATLEGFRGHGIDIPSPRREITFPATAETK